MRKYILLFLLSKLIFALKLYIDATNNNIVENYFDNLESALKTIELLNSMVEIIVVSDLMVDKKIMINTSVSIRSTKIN